MRRLRIKQEPCTSRQAAATQQHLPSSSSSLSPLHSSTSPNSPVGRIAKRNARLLNGLDLGSHVGGGYAAENLVGTIPDFSIRSIQESCPSLVQALDSSSETGIDDGLLTDLQFQLESLLADNIDWQKNIFGEMTFLQTGDYPTDDLKSRPMPSYELRTDGTIAQPSDLADPQPSISYVDHYKQEDDDAGSDVISSMDERELDEPYCVLDIPHRFWTWVREYVGHVDEKFLRDFQQQFYDRYQPDQLDEFFINEPFKYKPTPASKHPKDGSPKQHLLNGLHPAQKAELMGRKGSKSSAIMNGSTNSTHQQQQHDDLGPSPPKRRPSVQVAREMWLRSLKSPEEDPADLMKKLVAAYVEEKSTGGSRRRGRRPSTVKVTLPAAASPSKSTPKSAPKKAGPVRKPSARQSKRPTAAKRTKLNGDSSTNGRLINGHGSALGALEMNGSVESSSMQNGGDHPVDLNNEALIEAIGRELADCVLPATAGTSAALNSLETDSEEEDSDADDHEPSQDDPAALSNNMENYEMIKLRLDSKHDIANLDEVSTELLKAQQRLEHLVKKTAPTLNKCKKELEAEHSHWITTRALNSIDDELFRLANQIPMGATQLPEELFKQCLEVWDMRKHYLIRHYIRDHAKFVQFAEKTANEGRVLPASSATHNLASPAAESSSSINKRLQHQLENTQDNSIGTKTRAASSRKKSAVKREIVADVGDD